MKHNFPFLIKVIICLTILLIGSLCLNLYLIRKPQNIMIKNTSKNIVNKGLISMMLEQNDGKYTETEEQTWPQGYIVNKNLSGCENGSTITWDEETKQVKVNSSGSDKCYLYFAQDNYANRCKLGYVAANTAVCTILSKYGQDQNLYYHDGNKMDSNSDLKAGDNSYRYSGGDYQVADDKNYATVNDIIEVTLHTDNGTYNTYKLKYKDSEEKRNLKEVLQEAIADGYLKEKKINNFVCMPTTIDETCSNDNLYRIRGVFPNNTGQYEIALIKYDYATTSQMETGYDSNGANFDNYLGQLTPDKIATYAFRNDVNGGYTTGDLNLNKLNGTFLNKLNSDQIAPHTWVTNINRTRSNAKEAYDYKYGSFRTKIGDPSCSYNLQINNCEKEDLETNQKIGLIAFSDYMYASDPAFWNISPTYYSTVILNNWLFLGYNDMTISTYLKDTEALLIFISQWGGTGGHTTHLYNSRFDAMRPTFYLKSDTVFTAGDGSLNNPYKI